MGVHLRHYPEYRLELGVLCGSVPGEEMLRLFQSFDKSQNGFWFSARMRTCPASISLTFQR